MRLSANSYRRRIDLLGRKNIGPQIVNETGDLQSHFAGLVGNHVKAVVIPLHAGFVRYGRSELVIPGALEGVVIGMNRTARRKGGQRLHVGRLLQVMSISVGDRKLIGIVEVVIQAAGRQVFVCVVGKHSPPRSRTGLPESR